jgi:hypothetical protein
MDIALYSFASLLGAGNVLGDTRGPRESSIKSIETKIEEPNGINIYESRDFAKVSAEEARRASENWNASKDPVGTGIIPRYFNTIQIDFGTEKKKNPNFNSTLMGDIVGSLDSMAKADIEKRRATGRTTNAGSGSTTAGAAPQGFSKEEREVELDQIGGSLLPGGDMSHQNMVPYYRGSLKQTMDIENRMSDGKLEIYTGQFKLNRAQKEETASLFKPEESKTNIYGNHEVRDLSRIIPSNLGKKNSETPFEKIIVGPGLNNGFTAAPSGGLHNTLRILPKKTEDTVIDPVFESEGRVNHGKALIQNRPLVAPMFVNRQKVLIENKAGERNFTTVGAVTGRKLRPQIIVKDTNRRLSSQVVGHAGATTNLKRKLDPTVRATRRKNFKNTPFRNATKPGGFKETDYGKSSFTNNVTNRSETSFMHILNPTNIVNAISSYFTDSAKKTRKQEYVHNRRTTGNSKAQRQSGGAAYNPDEWRAKRTIKETTHLEGYVGTVAGEEKGGRTYDPEAWRAKSTTKETTHLEGYVGSASGEEKAGRTYDPETWRAKRTTKETTHLEGYVGSASGEEKGKTYDPEAWRAKRTTKETTHLEGYVGTAAGEEKAGRTYDPEAWRAKSTTKETTHLEGYVGGVAGEEKGGRAYDPEAWRAKSTIKETTNLEGYVGTVLGEKKGNKAYDPETWRAKPTTKQSTLMEDYVGGVAGEMQNGNGYKTNKYEARNTIKQFLSDNEHIGPGNSANRKAQSYDAGYAAETNVLKEKIATGRAPTEVRGKLAAGVDRVVFESKKIDGDRVNRRVHMKTAPIMMCGPSRPVLTSERNYGQVEDTRLDGSILSLKRNGYVQRVDV